MDFIQFGRIHGLEIIHEKLYSSEKIRRCGTTDKPKSLNGAYYFDGQRGWVCNWSDGARVEWWNDPTAKPWTEEEKAQWQAQRQAAKREQEASYLRAAQRADLTLKQAKSDKHAYLHRKGFPDAHGLVREGVLLIPMRHVQTNALQGLQQIEWVEAERKYKKRMFTGMRAKAAVFRMGPAQAKETFLCEGYATGLSIHAALRSIGSQAAVLVCFSAVNLEHVASLTNGRRFVCADNDASKTGQETAEATGLPWCMPDEEGQDFNDLHVASGLFPVVRKLMAVRLQQEVAHT